MEIIRNFPLFTIVLSLFSGVLCFMLKRKAARVYTIVFEIFLIALVSCILFYVIVTGEQFTYSMGEFPAPWGNEIRAGILEALMALFFMAVMLCSVLAGARFIDVDMDESKVNLYYSLINLMTAALMALIWTNDIFTGYVFLEILTLTSCGIMIVREIGRTTLAAVRYMILNLLGSGLFLLGVVLLYDITGNLLMVPMHEIIAQYSSDPAYMRILILSMGILSIGLAIKSGLFPFHYWMPDTYGWSTPTSASVLSSLVSKAYIFLLFKIYYRVIGVEVFEQMPIRNILLVLGVAGMIMGSISAIRENNLNRMVAFSSAAQIGYIYMGIGIGGAAGYTAAIFHIFAHSVTKSLLFLTTPRLAEASGGSLKFKNLQGCALRDPLCGVVFVIGALSMIGIPIFAGFSSKLLFAIAAVDSGDTIKMYTMILALSVSSVLNVMYFLRTVVRIYSVPREDAIHEVKDRIMIRHHMGYNISMVILIAANLLLGLISGVVVNLITSGLSMFG